MPGERGSTVLLGLANASVEQVAGLALVPMRQMAAMLVCRGKALL